MIRVAFLTPTIHIGGAENWILTLAQHFVHCDPVGVLVTNPHYHPDQLRRAAKIMPVEMARDGESIPEIQERLANLCKKADVLITWGEQRLRGLIYDRRGHKLITIPVIDVSHSDGEWKETTPIGDKYPGRDLVRQSAPAATHWVAVSEAAVSAFPETIQPQVKVIPNGVDVNRCVPRRSADSVRRQYGLESFQKICLFLGRYSQVKQPLKLVEAAKLLPPEWCTVFFGHGPMESELRDAVEGFDNIKVFGTIQHPGDVLQFADVMAMPSIAEGHPLTANEAWLAGVPVVATIFSFSAKNNNGFELIDENATAEEFAKAISGFHSNDNLTYIRNIAWQNYTASAFAQRWEEYLFAVTCSELQQNILGAVQ